MCKAHCANCTLCTSKCTQHTEHCNPYIEHCNMYTAHLLYFGNCILNSLNCIISNCSPYSLLFTLYTLGSPARKPTLLSPFPPQTKDSFYPPLVESTKNGIPEEFLLRRAPQLLLKWSTPFFHQKRMVLLISSSCRESSSFPLFEESSPKEKLRGIPFKES